MKKIEVTIKPHELEPVRDALVELGISGMTMCEVRTYDPSPHSEWYRGAHYAVPFTPQIKIEVVTAEDRLAACVAAISRCTGPDAAGRGAIAVLPVEETIRVRTGQQHPARAA